MPTPDAIASGTIATSGDIVALDTRAQASAVIAITGTWTGTVQFEYTPDNSNWFALPVTPETGGATVTSATGTGVWRADVAAFPQVRVRASSAITGTASVRVEASALHVPSGGTTNPANGAYAACTTVTTGNNTDTPLVFAAPSVGNVVNHLFVTNLSAAVIYVNPFGVTSAGPLIPVAANGGALTLDWSGMTPHLLTPGGAVAINSGTAGTGIVLAAGV